MLRPLGRWAIAGTVIALAVSSPTLANAQPVGHTATAQSIAATHPFPSASSTVIASTGFIDGERCGYFWSVSRGDSVAESFSGPARIRKAIFRLDVPTNALASGATVDWTASINGKDIGSFQVVSGQLGGFTEKFKFKAIKGGNYAVKIRVTNEVASGDGSITLRYAGAGQHSVTLKKK